MNTSLYIARRYLFSKKTTHVINIISIISMVGVALAAMALVVTLSVFNGFHDLVASLFSHFDTELKVVPAEGKTLAADDPVLTALRSQEGVAEVSETLEDQALAVWYGHQRAVMVKGVDDKFLPMTRLDDTFVGDRNASLSAANLSFALPGIGVAQQMGMSARYSGWLYLYAPVKEGQVDMMNPAASFYTDSLLSAGAVFQVQQGRYDNNYVLVPLSFARQLFGCDGMVSALEITVDKGSDAGKVKQRLQTVGGDKVRILDRYEQQEETFNVMNIEKLIAYVFLTFILLVACFNLVGSLSMLMIDKRHDVQTLRSMGATDRQVVRIFLFEGRLITIIGAVIGIAIGLLLCWLQQRYGIVRLGTDSNMFIVNAYPVSVHLTDVLIVFVTVIVVGFLAAWYPTRYLSRRLLQ